MFLKKVCKGMKKFLFYTLPYHFFCLQNLILGFGKLTCIFAGGMSSKDAPPEYLGQHILGWRN